MLDEDQSTAKGLISPEWLRHEGISLNSFMISYLQLPNMAPHSPYRITDVKGGIVTVRFTTAYGYQSYPLMIKVSNENGRYYYVPEGVGQIEAAIDPFWYEDELRP